MPRFVLLGIATASLCLGCHRSDSADRLAIASARDSLVASVLRADADSVAASFAPDAEIWAPDAPTIQGRDSIRALFAALFQHSRITRYTLHAEMSAFTRDTTFENGTYREGVQADTLHTTLHGRYMFTWVRGSDQRWRIRRLLFNHGPQRY